MENVIDTPYESGIHFMQRYELICVEEEGRITPTSLLITRMKLLLSGGLTTIGDCLNWAKCWGYNPLAVLVHKIVDSTSEIKDSFIRYTAEMEAKVDAICVCMEGLPGVHSRSIIHQDQLFSIVYHLCRGSSAPVYHQRVRSIKESKAEIHETSPISAWKYHGKEWIIDFGPCG